MLILLNCHKNGFSPKRGKSLIQLTQPGKWKPQSWISTSNIFTNNFEPLLKKNAILI